VRYINEVLPQPDGTHVAKNNRFGAHPYEAYFKEEKPGKNSGEKAYQLFRKRRADIAAGQPSSPEADKLDEEIKKDLVQINIEGIDQLFASTTSMEYYWFYLKDKKVVLSGMTEKEKQDVEMNRKEALPKYGWVVEVRGFTYHRDGDFFLKNT